MKAMVKPSFSTYFCIQLILQFCSTYCEVGHCASLEHSHQFTHSDNSNDNANTNVGAQSGGVRVPRKQMPGHELHIHDSYSHDPFVYNWFKSQPNYIAEMLIRQLWKESIGNDELLEAFLEGMFPQPGFNPMKQPRDESGMELLANTEQDRPPAILTTTESDPQDVSTTMSPEWVPGSVLEDRDFGSIINICNAARVRETSDYDSSSTPAEYDEGDLPVEDEEAPEGCYFYTGDQTFKNYLVCSEVTMTEVPDDLPAVLDVFEMNHTSVECIRSKAFEDVSIQLLRLNRNKIQGVASSAFEGAKGIKHLSLNHNHMRIPIWFFSAVGLEEIELLEMDTNKINMDLLLEYANGQLYDQIKALNTIEGEGPFLTKLRYLALSNNPIGFIPSFFFNRFYRTDWFMLTIYLVNCNLRDIHEDAFIPFKSIYLLDLSENPDLGHDMIGAATAMAKANVMKLTMAHNSMGSVPTEALSILEGSLTGLDLRGNSFSKLTDDSFPVMSKLTALNLDSCRLSQISKHAFANLLKLDTLSLRGNSLLSIPVAISPLVNLNSLLMSDNRNEANNQFIIGENAFENLGKIMTLYLNNLRLKSLSASTFQWLKKLKLLHMVNSQLETIEDEIFKETPSLTFLDLSDNPRLRGINAKTFKGLENLDSLYMRSCELEFPASVREERNLTNRFRKPAPGTENDSLEAPDEERRVVEDAIVDFVTIGQVLNQALHGEEDDDDEEGIQREPFRYLKRLKWLDLNDNKISKLYPELFKNMPFLHSLDLNKNSIQAWTRRVFANNTLLQELKLSKNHMLTTSDSMLEDFDDVHTNIDLGENPYSCDIGICNLKAAIANKSFYAHEWTTAPGRYMCFMAANKQVRIDSLTVEFCEELDSDSTTNPGEDTEETTTEDGEGATNGSPRAEGPEGGTSSFSVTTLAIVGVSLIVVILGALVFYKKRLHLKYFWFDFKLNLTKGRQNSGRSQLIRTNSNLSADSNIAEYDFDVFISYSHHDSGFIQEHVVPVLEGKGKFLMNEKTATVTAIPEVFNPVLVREQQQKQKVSTTSIEATSSVDFESAFKICLHERDFEVGASITENIIDSVDRSRKVVIVVSRNYLESQWCLFEMNLAYHRLIEIRRKSFVLILLEEVPAELRTKVLNYLMKSTTYLQWPGEKASASDKKIFWTRLRHSLKTTA